MSALGQKPTCAPQEVMSALPPKADMCGAATDVRFGPIADMQRGKNDRYGLSRITVFYKAGEVGCEMSRHVRRRCGAAVGRPPRDVSLWGSWRYERQA
jgi:hypothetical protein